MQNRIKKMHKQSENQHFYTENSVFFIVKYNLVGFIPVYDRIEPFS